MEKQYHTFEEFYPYYKSEHRQTGTRISHFIGTSLFFGWLITGIVYREPIYLIYAVVSAYGLAWVGHFFIEKNKPSTFQYPEFSLRGDFKLYFEIWTGREKFNARY